MADIKLGNIELTNKQLNRLSEAHGTEIRGFMYREGELTVNHKKDSLSEAEKAAILAVVAGLPDADIPDTAEQAEMKAIKNKPDKDITLADVVKALRKAGLI